jgi:hypothetical protein
MLGLSRTLAERPTQVASFRLGGSLIEARPPMILSDNERRVALDKLEEVRALQGAFWDALLQLEVLTGLELCSDVDYADYGLETIEGATEEAQHRK